VFTDADALVAAYASVGEKLKVRFKSDAFWVVTPEAAQCASLEENGRPDARSVVN
jgi:hypothetical protein